MSLTEYLKKSNSIFHIIVILVTFGITAASNSIGKTLGPDYQIFAISLAASLLSVSFIFIIRDYLRIDEIREEAKKSKNNAVVDSDACGLFQTMATQAAYGQEHWHQLVLSASSEVDLMGRSLSLWVESDDTIDLIVDKINKENVKFRWIVMDEKNDFINLLIEGETHIGTNLRNKIEITKNGIIKIAKRLDADKIENLKVGSIKKFPLYFSMVRSDSKICITHYMSRVDSNSSPMSLVEGPNKSWYTRYKLEFDHIWKAAESVTLIPAESQD